MWYFLQTEPFLMQKLDNVSNGAPYVGNDRFEGYCADLAKKVSDIIKIDYKIEPVKDGKYGSKDENSSWNGMVGELVRKVSVVWCFRRKRVSCDFAEDVSLSKTTKQSDHIHQSN